MAKETMNNTQWQNFKKRHPEAVIGVVSQNGHQVRVAYYGSIVSHSNGVPLYKYYTILAIQHPKTEKQPCRFLPNLRKTDKFKEMLVTGTPKAANPVRVYNSGATKKTCPECRGAGFVKAKNCPTCKGTGRVYLRN